MSGNNSKRGVGSIIRIIRYKRRWIMSRSGRFGARLVSGIADENSARPTVLVANGADVFPAAGGCEHRFLRDPLARSTHHTRWQPPGNWKENEYSSSAVPAHVIIVAGRAGHKGG